MIFFYALRIFFVIFTHLGGLTQSVIRKKGLLSSFPHCVHRNWTEEQEPKLSNTPISIYALGYCALYCFPVCCGHIWSVYRPLCGLCQPAWAY